MTAHRNEIVLGRPGDAGSGPVEENGIPTILGVIVLECDINGSGSVAHCDVISATGAVTDDKVKEIVDRFRHAQLTPGTNAQPRHERFQCNVVLP